MRYIVEISKILKPERINEEARKFIKQPEVMSVSVVKARSEQMIFVTVDVVSGREAQQFLDDIDMVCNMRIHEVLYSPQDHSALADPPRHMQPAIAATA